MIFQTYNSQTLILIDMETGMPGKVATRQSMFCRGWIKIEKPDHYLLHIGTNDWPIGNTDFTYDNIVKIANGLAAKGGEVLILTILPRLDENDARNVAINQEIRDWNGRDCNCRIIDLDTALRKSGDLKSMYWDAGIHPNAKGHERIVGIICPQLERIIEENKAHL